MPSDAISKFDAAINKMPLAQAVIIGLESLEREISSTSKFKNFLITKLASKDKQSERNKNKQYENDFLSNYLGKINYDNFSVLDILNDPEIEKLPKGAVIDFFKHVKNIMTDNIRYNRYNKELKEIATKGRPITAYEEYRRLKIPDEFKKNLDPSKYTVEFKDLDEIRLKWRIPSLDKNARFYYVLENKIDPEPPKYAYHGTSIAIFKSILTKGLNNVHAEEVIHKGVMTGKVEGVTFCADDQEWVRYYAVTAGETKNTAPTILRWKIGEKDGLITKGEIGVYPRTVKPNEVEFAIDFGKDISADSKDTVVVRDLTWYPITEAVPVMIGSYCFVVPVKVISSLQTTQKEIPKKESKEEEEESKSEFKPF